MSAWRDELWEGRAWPFCIGFFFNVLRAPLTPLGTEGTPMESRVLVQLPRGDKHDARQAIGGLGPGLGLDFYFSFWEHLGHPSEAKILLRGLWFGSCSP